MRKILIASSYIFCAVVYTTFSIAIYQMLKTTEYETTMLSTLNKAMMISFGVIVVCMPMLFIFKKNRIKAANSVAAVVDDFIRETYEPLKRNLKRKEFWILQGYLLTRFLTFLNKYICIVFIFPAALFIIDSSKEVFSFMANLITITIFIDLVKMVWHVCERNWTKCINRILHIFILISTSVSMERFYNPVKHAASARDLIFGNYGLKIGILILSYVVLVRSLRNLIISDIEKDISLELNLSETPSYSLKKYRDLIEIDSIKYQWYGLNENHSSKKNECQPGNKRVTYVGHLRYGLLQFEMEQQPITLLGKMDKLSKSPAKLSTRPIDDTSSKSKEVEK